MATQNSRELGCFFFLKFVLAISVPGFLLIRGAVPPSDQATSQWLALLGIVFVTYSLCLWFDGIATRIVYVQRQRGITVNLAYVMALDSLASLAAANLFGAFLLWFAERMK